MRMPLKQPDEIFDPDPRSTSFVKLDAVGQHSKTIGDHHRQIAAVRMTDRVPEEIRAEFDTARNLYLYSWYVYDFTVPATLYAHALIEKTVKEKCSRSGLAPPKHAGLKKLLKLSICRGWLTNAAFEFALDLTRQQLVPPADPDGLPAIRSVPLYDPTGTDFCEHLAESLPEIRNMGAHGEAGLGLPTTALHGLEICACIANALFRDSADCVSSQAAEPIA